MHALRHFYASVLLDAGENVKALSLYLGHSVPGFTLRVYTHLMPSSETRTLESHLRDVPGRRSRSRRPRDSPGCLRRPLIGGKTAGEGLFRALGRKETPHLA